MDDSFFPNDRKTVRACGHRSLHPAQPNSTVLRKRKRFLGRSNFVNPRR